MTIWEYPSVPLKNLQLLWISKLLCFKTSPTPNLVPISLDDSSILIWMNVTSYTTFFICNICTLKKSSTSRFVLTCFLKKQSQKVLQKRFIRARHIKPQTTSKVLICTSHKWRITKSMIFKCFLNYYYTFTK